jgi:hypothetical protein
MSITKIRASRCIRVIPSDTIGIPSLSAEIVSGTTTATTAGKLVDSSKSFIVSGVAIGDIVYNTTDFTSTKVTALDSPTSVSVANNIFAVGENYKIFFEETKSALFMIGQHGAGNSGTVRVLTSGGDDVTIDGMVTGEVIPIDIRKVFATGTTVLSVYALW